MAHLQSVQKKTSSMSLTISSSSREISSCSSSCSSSSSSALASQRHSSQVQPLCIDPQTTQSPQYNQQYSGNGVAPTFVKCLHDVSTVKGQLVVLECRLRGTPPLQVLWYREDQHILDSDDFRILRKKASSASVPEELCTLVITEAFPEDSGLFKCMALNPIGTVSCSAELEVYEDLEEQLENEALRQQKAVSLVQEKETVFQQKSASGQADDYTLLMQDPINLPPPDWPEENSSISNIGDYPETLPAVVPPEEPLDPGENESLLSSAGQRSAEVPVLTDTHTPSPPPPSPPLPSQPSQAKENSPAAKLFTPIKISFTSSSKSGNGNMSVSDLPSFKPSSIPPSAFNYERPRHFIQSQPSFQAPSYESVLRDAQQDLNSPTAQNSQGLAQSAQKLVQSSHGVGQNSVSLSERQAQSTMASKQSQAVSHSQTLSQSNSQSQTISQSHSKSQSISQSQSKSQSISQSQSKSQSVSQSVSQAQFRSQIQANGTSKSSSDLSSTICPAPHPSISTLPRTPMRASITLTPSLPSATGLGSATLPANPDPRSRPAAFLCSVLPSQSIASSSARSPLSPGRALPVSPSMPRSPVSSSSSSSAVSQKVAPPHHGQAPPHHGQAPPHHDQGPPAVVSLPVSYKGGPSTLPKPILKKSVAPRPSSARSDDDIQGSKDALIQDLEKKLRSKEARRRTSQKLSYEERMARRLLGPDNASYVFDQEDTLDPPQDQCDIPEGRHTGGLWGKHHVGANERGNEGSAIQEKCYAPRFLQIPPDITVEEGRFCRIDFKVGGLPTPDVCWYLDGKAIRPDDYHKMLVCEKSMHSFIIEIVTVHHAGVYECVAKNRAGESRFSMRLDVIAQEALRPPTFIQKMTNSRALEGDTVRFECKVDASPPPQLFWKKDKDMLRIDPNRMSLYQDGSGRQCLLVERLVKADAGWYTLSAINEAGMSTCNARLDVGTRKAPVMKTAPPGSKTLKLLSSLSHLPVLTVDSPAQHTAPLYESEEL